MKEPQNFSNWTDSDFDPSNRPRSISVEWWDENYVKPAREYREYYKRLCHYPVRFRFTPDPLLNPGCPYYWFGWAQDPSILEVEEEDEKEQENEVPAEYLAELNEQLGALREGIVLPEVPSDISATRGEAEANRIMAELEASRRAVFDEATQELWKAFEAAVPGTRQWEASQMHAGPSIGKKDQSFSLTSREKQVKKYLRTQVRPSKFALSAVASGTLPDIYDKKAVAPFLQMIYQGSVSAEYWNVTPNMYAYLATDAGAIAYLEDVLEGKVIVPRTSDNKDGELPNFVWTDDEWSELSRYVNEWKANVTDFQRLCPGEKISKATAQNKQIRTTLRNKMDPFYIEPSSEDVVRQHNQQLYESVNQIIEKVMSGESLPPEATRERQLLYEYYRSYYYYKVGSEGLPGFKVDDVPERKITPEEIIDSLTNNQSSINHSIPSQSNLAPEDIDVEVVSVHDHPLDERVLEEMLCEIFAEYSNQ